MVKNVFVLAMAVAILTLGPSQTFALDSVGKVVKATGSAKASNSAGKRALRRGGSVFSSDTIRTGSSGIVSVVFSDSTKLAIGPRSTIKIVNFRPSKNRNRAKVFAIRAARGTFRFISGRSRKSAYKISAGSVTIGIRGTAFDFTVRGRTSVMHYSGAIVVCVGGRCATLKNKCDVARQSGAGMKKTRSSNLTDGALRVNFPFIRGERRLPSSFRVRASTCGEGAGPAGDVGPDGGGDGGGG